MIDEDDDEFIDEEKLDTNNNANINSSAKKRSDNFVDNNNIYNTIVINDPTTGTNYECKECREVEQKEDQWQ